MPASLVSAVSSLILWLATADARLHHTLPNTHRQACLSLLWGHYAFLLGPGDAQALQESLFPQPCGSSVIKSHWPSKSNSLRFSSLCQIPKLGNLLWALDLSQ